MCVCQMYIYINDKKYLYHSLLFIVEKKSLSYIWLYTSFRLWYKALTNNSFNTFFPFSGKGLMYFNRCYKGSISVIEHSLLRKTFSTARLIILASTLPRQGIMHIIKTKNSTITTKKPFQFKKLSLKSNHTNLLLSISWLNPYSLGDTTILPINNPFKPYTMVI